MRKSEDLFRRSNCWVFFVCLCLWGGGDPGAGAVAAAAGVAAVGGGGSILGSVPLCYSERGGATSKEGASYIFFFWVLVL